MVRCDCTGGAPALCAGQSGADAGPGVSGGADVLLDGSSLLFLGFDRVKIVAKYLFEK